MFKVETVGTPDDHMSIHDTPEEAMKAVNRLRMLALAGVTISDKTGQSVTERQLAMVVAARRLRMKPSKGL